MIRTFTLSLLSSIRNYFTRCRATGIVSCALGGSRKVTTTSLICFTVAKALSACTMEIAIAKSQKLLKISKTVAISVVSCVCTVCAIYHYHVM